jgi:3-isopropylmalate dehydratase small subunit
VPEKLAFDEAGGNCGAINGKEWAMTPRAVEVDGFRRHCLLNGLDDIGLTLQYEEKISEFERRAAG